MITLLINQTIYQQRNVWGTNKLLDNSSFVTVNSEHDIRTTHKILALDH